jgi:hypothetical protein
MMFAASRSAAPSGLRVPDNICITRSGGVVHQVAIMSRSPILKNAGDGLADSADVNQCNTLATVLAYYTNQNP